MPPRGWKRQPFEVRLWGNIEATEGCWLWRGNRSSDGYGRIHAFGKRHRVHRLVYELVVAPVADTDFVHHKCENKLCVNPEHLEAMSPNKHNTLHMARTICRRGHVYEGHKAENRDGGLANRCFVCHRQRQRNYYERLRARGEQHAS